ncbi:MAG: prephenate dehydrogenase/arogenate dehydrogenase family protein [Candidatus Omnitrophota bacterium]|nr:prephenate dehydrogenase/arogenate dehydrogenase family protein [Candidatus Omnitrophota bacterium]
MEFRKIVIIGMGFVGGSIGKALLEKGLADEVVGVCRRQSSLDRAVKEKSLSTGYVNDYEKAVEGADVIFIATPVHTIEKVLDGLAEVLEGTEVIVTDVGSTKKKIVDHASRYSDRFSFVGGHPLAGSEKTGVEYSSPDLFDGSLCVLTKGESTPAEAVDKVKKIWKALGAVVHVTTPEGHDKILAFTSHLPHVAAYTLAGVQDLEFIKYMSTGFRDTARIASSDPESWSDIFLSNRDNLLKAIARFKELLSGIEDDIREGREESLKEKLKMCKRIRDGVI